jgi:hypothetical protein
VLFTLSNNGRTTGGVESVKEKGAKSGAYYGGWKTKKETALATWPSQGAKQITSLKTLV